MHVNEIGPELADDRLEARRNRSVVDARGERAERSRGALGIRHDELLDEVAGVA